MNPFARQMTANAWVVPVSGLSLVLGFMVMAASITNETRSSRLSQLGASQNIRVGAGTLDIQSEFLKVSNEVSGLRAENTKLQAALGTHDNSSKVLNESLQEIKVVAGLTDLEGPGIQVTLTDSKRPSAGSFQALNQVIHDTDVLHVTNELFAAGAEAIDVNGHRLIATSSIRCVGPVIHVDRVPVASPIVVRAIGDPKAMAGGLEMPGGVMAEIRQTDPSMVQIEPVQNMRILAFSGSTSRQIAKVPATKK